MAKKRRHGKGVYLNKLLNFLEKDRTNLVTAAILILLYIVIRMYFEGALFHREESGEVKLLMYNAFHQITGLFTAFLGGTLIITFLAKEKLRKVVDVMLCGFWLIILGPLIDFYVFHRAEGYRYIEPTESLAKGAGPGLIIQLSIICCLAIAYVLIKSRSVVRALASGVFLLALLGFAAMVPFFLSLFYSPTTMGAGQIFVTLFFFLLSTVFVAIVLDLTNKKILPIFLRKMKVQWLLYFLMIGIAGFTLSGRFVFWESGGFVDEMPYGLLAVFTMLLAAQFALMMGDISLWKRIKKKRIHGIFTRDQYLQFAILLALFSLAFAIQLGMFSTLFCLGFLFMGWVYYSSPIRLADRRFGAFAFGALSSIAFMIGFLATKELSELTMANWVLLGPWVEAYNLPQTAVIVLLSIFIMGCLLHLLLRRLEVSVTKKPGKDIR